MASEANTSGLEPRAGGSSPAGGKPRRPSPAVLRRRRLVAALLALLLIAALTAGGFWIASMLRQAGQAAPGDGANAASGGNTSGTDPDGGNAPDPEAGTAGASPQASDPAGPAPSAPASGAPVLCPAAAVSVTGRTDAETYGPGKNPVLILEVANNGSVPCAINVGTSQMEFSILSGTDRIFSSRDCQVDAQDALMTLQPGDSEEARFVWERNRSAPGCEAVEARPGLGYYVLVTKLGEKSSDRVTFQLV